MYEMSKRSPTLEGLNDAVCGEYLVQRKWVAINYRKGQCGRRYGTTQTGLGQGRGWVSGKPVPKEVHAHFETGW